jgi:UDP-glucose 4-epimerase
MNFSNRAYVTGGAGFLGSHICRLLLQKGLKVYCIDISDNYRIKDLKKNKNFSFYKASILNIHKLKKIIKKNSYIYHFAAIADPLKYVQQPLKTLNIDLKASINIFELASNKKCKIIFASTSEVYGKNSKVPWSEDDDRVLGSTKINRWCYSSSKAVSEHYLIAYAKEKNLKFVIFRFFNVYGPSLDSLGNGRVLTMMLNRFLKNKDVLIHGNGKQTRSFSYIDDVVDEVIQVSHNKKCENDIYNIGSNDEIKIIDLAKKIKRLGNFSSKLKFIDHKKVFGKSYEDVPRRVPSLKKINKFLKKSKKINLDYGLKKIISFYKGINS